MNKKELIELVAQKTSLSKAQATEAVTATFEAITECLKKGDEFSLVNFGRFATRYRKEREGRNPANGKTYTIAAGSVPFFSPGKGLKNTVAGVKPQK